jgi:hypothetical protein
VRYPAVVRRRHLIALLVIFGVVAIGFAIILREPSEPAYRGRTLSDWIVATRVHPKDHEARLAMRQLASNSIPALLDWVWREDRPTPKARIAAAKDWAITFLERHRVIEPQSHRVFMDWKGSHRVLAQWALEELGPDAKPAVPALVQMLGTKGPTTNDGNLRMVNQ